MFLFLDFKDYWLKNFTSQFNIWEFLFLLNLKSYKYLHENFMIDSIKIEKTKHQHSFFKIFEKKVMNNIYFNFTNFILLFCLSFFAVKS